MKVLTNCRFTKYGWGEDLQKQVELLQKLGI